MSLIVRRDKFDPTARHVANRPLSTGGKDYAEGEEVDISGLPPGMAKTWWAARLIRVEAAPVPPPKSKPARK